MSYKFFYSNNRGFSLQELVLASAILVLALAGLLLLFANCVLLNDSNRERTIATSHAQYILEGIRNLNFTNVSTEISNDDWDWNTAQISSAGLSPMNNESINTNYTGTNPLNLTVAVNWKDGRSRNRNLTLNSRLTQF